MTNLTIKVSEVKGLLPALDPRVVEVPYIIDGMNFIFDVQGPFAAFANSLVGYVEVADPIGFDAFEVGDTVFHLFNEGVFKFDLNSQLWILQFPFTGLTSVARWSTALVGAKHYFCREDVGLIQYDPATLKWKPVTTDVPAGALSITQSNGRLVILGADSYAWSALDDGEDLSPSLSTGAGIQSTAIIGGDSIAIGAYNQGFLTYTSKGVIRAAFIGGTAIFRHTQLTVRLKLFNKFSIINLDNEEHVILTNLGLFITSGTNFEQLDPVFNEFIRELITTLDTSLVDGIKLFYDIDEEIVYVSQALVDDSHIFNLSYVFIRRLKKWGSFDREHYGFSKIHFDSGAEEGIHFGYIGIDKHFHYSTFNAAVEVAPNLQDGKAFTNIKEVQFPTYEDVSRGSIIVSSVCIVQTYDPANIPSTFEAGFYTLTVNPANEFLLEDGSSNFLLEDGLSVFLLEGAVISLIPSKIARTLEPLNSEITIGLFNYLEGQFPDEYSLITNVAVSAGFVPVGQTVEDWNVLVGSQDWNLLSGFIDRGEGVPSTEIFDISLITTNDGVNTANYDDIIQDVSLIPNLYKDDGKFAFYSAYQSGLYHKIRLEAINVGDSFHLDLLQISGSLSGRP